MGSYDKLQMMDAGMTRFRSDESFGNVLGMVKGTMSRYGKVLRKTDVDEASLPDLVRDFDLFLDLGTPWRRRLIACHLEQEEGGHYAVTFREGNRSSILRAVFFSAAILTLAGLVILGVFNPIVSFICLALAAFLGYGWIVPSRRPQRIVSELLSKLKSE